MNSILAPFEITLESVISRPAEAATSKTPKKKMASRVERVLSRTGPPPQTHMRSKKHKGRRSPP